MLKLFRAVALVCLFAGGAPPFVAPALAQEPAVVEVAEDFQPVIDAALSAAATVLVALISWAAWAAVAFIRAKTGVTIATRDSVLGANLDAAIRKGIEFAERTLRERYGGRVSPDLPAIDLQELAHDYVVERMPDTIKELGLEPHQIGEMVTARMKDARPGPA